MSYLSFYSSWHEVYMVCFHLGEFNTCSLKLETWPLRAMLRIVPAQSRLWPVLWIQSLIQL